MFTKGSSVKIKSKEWFVDQYGPNYNEPSPVSITKKTQGVFGKTVMVTDSNENRFTCRVQTPRGTTDVVLLANCWASKVPDVKYEKGDLVRVKSENFFIKHYGEDYINNLPYIIKDHTRLINMFNVVYCIEEDVDQDKGFVVLQESFFPVDWISMVKKKKNNVSVDELLPSIYEVGAKLQIKSREFFERVKEKYGTIPPPGINTVMIGMCGQTYESQGIVNPGIVQIKGFHWKYDWVIPAGSVEEQQEYKNLQAKKFSIKNLITL